MTKSLSQFKEDMLDMHLQQGNFCFSKSGLNYFFFRNSKEISIKRGSFFVLVKTINPKWLQIRDDSGEVGLVPANYVSFYEQELKCEALFSFKAQTARQVSFEKVCKI